MKPVGRSTEAILAEIKQLYYRTSRHTIARDFARALHLLASISSEDERERAAVYMDGLSQMRSDWARGPGKGKRTRRKERRDEG